MLTAQKKFKSAKERSEAYLAVWNEARDAGVAAGEAKLQELLGAGPKYEVLENAKGDAFSDPNKPERVVGTMLDLCGFAWVHLPRGNTSFARWALKQKKESGREFATTHYRRGIILFMSMTDRQEMSVKQAAARAAVEVFKNHGIDCYVESRLD